MRKLLILLLLCAAPAYGANKVKIGFISTLSGPNASIGIDIRDAFQLAIKHINGEGDGGMIKTMKPTSLKGNGILGKKVAFVGVNANKAEPAEEVRDHAKEHKFGFPVVKDPNNVIADAYGAMVTPEIFVVSKDLTILYHGRIDDSRKSEDVTKRDLALKGSAAITFSGEAESDQRVPAVVEYAISRPFRPWHEQRRFSRAARGLPPYRGKQAAEAV